MFSDVVREGQQYGPADHICDKMVSFERKCGHTTNMKCGEAFQQAQFSSKCSEDVTVVNPECGHKVITKCHEKQNLQRKGLLLSKQPVECVYEGRSSLTFGTSTFHVKCQEKVEFVRKCDHRQTVKCCEARDEHIQPCIETILAKNPLCMHNVTIPCHLSDFSGWKPWPDDHSPLPGGVLLDSNLTPAPPPDGIQMYVLNCEEDVELLKNACGHKNKTKCGRAMKEMATKNKTKCTVKIENAELNCGHFRKYLCWEYAEYLAHPEKAVCKEEVHLTCWNYASCNSVLTSGCHLTGQIMKCKEKTKYICPNGHIAENIPVCQEGIPSHCPECILAEIRAHNESLKKLKFQIKDIQLPGVPSELSKFNPEKIFNNESIKSFLDSQMAVLSNLENWTKKQVPLKRPLFERRMVPCFRYEFEGKFSLDFKDYMKAGTLLGVQVCEWTVNNIERLIREIYNRRTNHICLLLGFVFCCRVLVDPIDCPGQKKGSYKKSEWVKVKRHRQSYYVLQQNRNQWDNLIVWDPYPMVATHKLWLSATNLQELSSQLRRVSPPVRRAQLQPQFIRFQIPENAESMVTSKPIEPEEDDFEDILSANFRGFELREACGKQWDGLSLGSFDYPIQKELMSKLQCCIKASG